MKPELTRLYSLLELPHDCSLAELKLAYRRRIAQLQPRRHGSEVMTAEDAALLRELISLYTAANRFHRRHGRLPGADPRHMHAAGIRIHAVGPKPPSLPVPVGKPQRKKPEHGLFGLFILLLLSLALFTLWALVAAYMAGGDVPM